MEKRVQDYTQEILDTIRSNSSPAVMGSRLEDYHENDLADVLPLLTVPERCKLYRILDTDMLSDIFEYAESDNVAEYLEEMDVKKAASILSKMETDALAEVLQKLDKAKKKLLIELLDPEVRHDIEMTAFLFLTLGRNIILTFCFTQTVRSVSNHNFRKSKLRCFLKMPIVIT